MKQFMLLVSVILLNTSIFAESSKNFYSLKTLGSAWQTQLSHPNHSKNDMAIVYGGADISHRPLATPILVA